MQPVSPRSYRRIAWLEPARLPYGFSDQNIYSGILFPRAGPKMAALLATLGYEVEVISGELSRIDPDEIAASFDLACISVLSNTAPHGLVLGRWLSERGLPVVMGGYQFAHTQQTPESLRPTEQALAFVPYVVRGEGYAALPQLLDALQGRASFDAVGGLSYRDAAGVSIHNPLAPLLPREAINALPSPDWTVVRDREKMKVLAVHGMHGCPRHCSWCAVWPRDGRTDRSCEPAHFVDELEVCLEAGTTNGVFFSADNFPVRGKWAQEVCDEIIRRKLQVRWTCQAEVGASQNAGLVDSMIAAGCERWCLGLETVNAASLQESQKKQSREAMEACVTELHRRGLQIHGMFIVGLPHDTAETVQETVEWAMAMQLETVQFLCLADLPGSQDYEQYHLDESSFRPFEGAYEPLNWMFVNGHYARMANDDMDLVTVQDQMLGAMLRFYSLRHALRPLLRFNVEHFRAARGRGVDLWHSLKQAWWHNASCSLFRLWGYHKIRRWRRGQLNRAYLDILRAAPQDRAECLERILACLPATWLATLRRVAAEQQAVGTA